MDIVKTITTKIRRHNFTFREGRRIYYGLQMDTTRLVWARNLCEGWQIDIDGRLSGWYDREEYTGTFRPFL